jgi:hypothetical protein
LQLFIFSGYFIDDILQVEWYFLNSSAKNSLAHGQPVCDCKVAKNISEGVLGVWATYFRIPDIYSYGISGYFDFTSFNTSWREKSQLYGKY